MSNGLKKKICIVTYGLGGGGLEKVAAMQSIYLSDLGYDVFLVTVLNKVDYPFKGMLLNLGLYKNDSNSKLNRISRFLKLKKFIINNNIDVIIDHRPRKRWVAEWFINMFLYTKPTIFTVHSFKVLNYIPTKNKILNRLYNSSKKVVSVSKAIEQKLVYDYNISNVQTIYNPIVLKELGDIKIKELGYKYILWYGRLDDKIKNLKLLINSFKMSELINRNYKLVILGNGPDEKSIKQYVIEIGLTENVVFFNYVSNPLDYVHFSKFVVLTSRYEGFPMVLPEALSCGIPVIATDCESGPSEIINHRINGLLVENNNEKLLSEAMNEFVLDDELYQKCKFNAKNSVRHLSLSEIQKQWIKIIEDE